VFPYSRKSRRGKVAQRISNGLKDLDYTLRIEPEDFVDLKLQKKVEKSSI
jgi:hypothetical protein